MNRFTSYDVERDGRMSGLVVSSEGSHYLPVTTNNHGTDTVLTCFVLNMIS